MKVAGIDGCRKGWIVYESEDDFPNIYFIEKLSDFDARGFQAILIDMPLAFARDKYRPSEVQAKALLKTRRSTLFYSPSYKAFLANDYKKCCKINREEIGKALSKQVFNLFPKIEEAIIFKNKYPQTVYESHPELCFLGWKGSVADYSKKTVEGYQERMDLIKTLSLDSYHLINNGCLRGYKDDVVDAALLGLTAKQYSQFSYLGDVDPIVFYES